MPLQLTQEEREFLVDLLTSRHGELRAEIHHSVVSKFTNELKKTEVFLKSLIGKIEADDAGSSRAC